MICMDKEKLVEALKEIQAIAKGLTEFNPTYEKIYKITVKALEEEKHDK